MPLYARGARYLGLTHTGNNDICTSSGPLKELGDTPAPEHVGPEPLRRERRPARQRAGHDGRRFARLGCLRTRRAAPVGGADHRLALRRARADESCAQPDR